MSLESVASEAGTTVPSLRRRYPDKSALAVAAIVSLRVQPLPATTGHGRKDAIAVLSNFGENLRRPNALALLGTLLAEESGTPELLETFRERIAQPRRAALRSALASGVASGELSGDLDIEAAVSMLIGAFYAAHVAQSTVPRDWHERVLALIWPAR